MQSSRKLPAKSLQRKAIAHSPSRGNGHLSEIFLSELETAAQRVLTLASDDSLATSARPWDSWLTQFCSRNTLSGSKP